MPEPDTTKVNFGALGCGSIVERSFIPAIKVSPKATLLAATRSNTSKLADFCEANNIERAYPTTEALLSDADIDVVYIATPVGLHVEQIIAAAESGKHVLCEKPLGLNREESLKAQHVCSVNGVKLSVAYYRRGFPEVVYIRKLLAERRLGTLLCVKFHHGTWYSPDLGKESSWRIDPELGGGGALMDVGSHRIDLVQFLCGPTRRVCCRLSHQVHEGWPVETGATALLELVEGGEGHVSVYFNQRQKTDSLWIYGSEGNICCPKVGGGEVVVETDGECKSVALEPTPKSGTHIQLVNCVSGEILEGSENPFSVENVIASETILDACYRSARENAWVSIEDHKTS